MLALSKLRCIVIRPTIALIPVFLSLAAGAGVQAAPLTLNVTLQQADKTSPTLSQARREWQIAMQNLRNSVADLGWQLKATTDKNWSIVLEPAKQPSAALRTTVELSKAPAPGQLVSLTANTKVETAVDGTLAYGLSSVALGWAISYPFNQPSATHLALQQLSRAVEQKSASLDLAREDALSKAARSFFDLGKALLDVGVAEKQVNVDTLGLERQKALAQVGRIAERDLEIARQRLELAKLDLQAKHTQADLAKRNLGRQLGYSVVEIAGIQWIEPNWQTTNPGELEKWLNVVSTRPEVRQAELAVLSAREALATAQARSAYTIKPLVSLDPAANRLSAGLDITKVRENDSDFNTSASLRVSNDNLTFTTSFSALLGGADSSAGDKLKIDNAAANLATAEQNKLQSIEDAQDQVRSMWANLYSKAAQSELQASLLAREQLNSQIVQNQVDLGAATPYDLANAELSLTKAEADTKKARYDYQLAYLELVAATGNTEAVLQLGGQH